MPHSLFPGLQRQLAVEVLRVSSLLSWWRIYIILHVAMMTTQDAVLGFIFCGAGLPGCGCCKYTLLSLFCADQFFVFVFVCLVKVGKHACSLLHCLVIKILTKCKKDRIYGLVFVFFLRLEVSEHRRGACCHPGHALLYFKGPFSLYAETNLS